MTESTQQLLADALAKHDHSQSALARTLGVHRATIHSALTKGRASPTLAGQLATVLSKDAKHWIAVAALEAEPATPARDRLQRLLVHVRNS